MCTDYSLRECINLKNLSENPFLQFHNWFKQSKESGVFKPNAAALSTIENKIYPRSRTVMIKAYDEKGFVFFTDCKTDKVVQIERNSNVSLLFSWLEIERQVKILGKAEKITIREAFLYFSNRDDKMGYWIKEGGYVSSRLLLEQQLGRILKYLYNLGETFSDIFCGYRVVPSQVEFWQVCKDKLYQSFLYEKTDVMWTLKTLA